MYKPRQVLRTEEVSQVVISNRSHEIQISSFINISEAHIDTFLSQRNIFHAFEDPSFISHQIDDFVCIVRS